MAELVLIDEEYQVMARGAKGIAAKLASSMDLVSDLKRGDIFVMTEVTPEDVTLGRLLQELPADISALIAVAIHVGIDIGVDGAEGMVVAHAALDCCRRESGLRDQTFWKWVDRFSEWFGDDDALRRSLADALIATRPKPVATDPAPALVGAAFQVAA